MNQSELLQTISQLINDTMGNDSIVTLETSASDIPEWDSMTHLELISALESRFKIRFALGELQSLQNVGDMVNLITKKMN